ncbi:hypothetical protein OIU74_007651 [Salix koriyanagi]|uniref:Uncharacterized protein n=1 Tax=Salix koriyanagi TaxID=2511006 RepID=A0A9Q0U483_9ROSI|nr:hypothetical protein OIU74_007651 [Salix koriyanagi]
MERSPEKKRLSTNEEMKGDRNELKINECKESRSICDHHLNKIKPHTRSSGSCLGVAEPFIRKPVTRAIKGQTRDYKYRALFEFKCKSAFTIILGLGRGEGEEGKEEKVKSKKLAFL